MFNSRNRFPINVERKVSDVRYLILYAFLWTMVGMMICVSTMGLIHYIYGYDYGTPEEINTISDNVYNTYGITMPAYTDSLDAFFFSNCVKKQVVLDPQPTKEDIEQKCQDRVTDLKEMGDSVKTGMDQVQNKFNNLD